MRLGIDIDETIVDTHRLVMEYVQKYGSNLNFNCYEELHSNEGFKFLVKYIEDIHRNVRLFPNAKESLKILKEKDFELIFITARGNKAEYDFDYDHRGITEEMFNKYNIPHDKIIYECYPKGETAYKEKIDYFIDDKEENLDDAAKFGIKTIKVVANMDMPSKHLKFDNWKDILEFLLKEMGNGR